LTQRSAQQEISQQRTTKVQSFQDFPLVFPPVSSSRWPAGGAAKTMEASSDEEVQEAAMQVLRNIYGSDAKEPIACAVSRWGGDPYSRGQIPCGPSSHLLQQGFDQSCLTHRSASTRRFVTTDACVSYLFAFHVSSLWSGSYRLCLIVTLVSVFQVPECHAYSDLCSAHSSFEGVFLCCGRASCRA